MSYRVVFTETAKSDLRDIAFNLLERTRDKAVAKRIVMELQTSCETLKTFPESGAIPKDRILVSNGYRFLTKREYLLFYTFDRRKSTVYIIAVIDGRRDYVRILKRYL